VRVCVREKDRERESKRDRRPYRPCPRVRCPELGFMVQGSVLRMGQLWQIFLVGSVGGQGGRQVRDEPSLPLGFGV